jgi:hypothetical protein
MAMNIRVTRPKAADPRSDAFFSETYPPMLVDEVCCVGDGNQAQSA